MSEKYIPLYRKYRPQSFSDLIGQENITKALGNAINLNRISHAYLFCGPRGTGKTSTARILAKSLNCSSGPTLTPCDKCPGCLDVINSNPMDVIEIDAASNRSIEDTQKILEKIQYVPVHGKYKIYVIDEVHMLSNTSFNALLKTLEEPPANVIFILATTEAHKVLDTIISRCQRFDFRRITTADIVESLKKISDIEKINISEDALHSIAKNSAGGMRDSLSLLDQLSILNTETPISTEDVDDLLGKISNDILYELTQCVLNQASSDAIIMIDKIYAKGNDPLQMINNLILYFRNLLVLKNDFDKEILLDLTQLSEHYIAKMQPQAKMFEASHLVWLIEKLAGYLKEIKTSTNRYLWLELCIIDITTTKFASNDELLARIEKLENQISSGKNFTPPAQKSPKTQHAQEIKYNTPELKQEPVKASQEPPVQKQEKASAVTDSDIYQVWQNLLTNIESMPSRMFFQNLSTPLELTKDKIVISFAKDIFVASAKEESKIKPLQKAALDFFGSENTNIQIILGNADEKPQKPEKKNPEISQTQQPAKAVVEAQVEERDEQEDYYDNLLAKVKPEETPQPQRNTDHYSDQTKMVLDLFNGKYVD